jgi:hypothetical protein
MTSAAIFPMPQLRAVAIEKSCRSGSPAASGSRSVIKSPIHTMSQRHDAIESLDRPGSPRCSREGHASRVLLNPDLFARRRPKAHTIRGQLQKLLDLDGAPCW